MSEKNIFPVDPYEIVGDGSWKECVQRVPDLKEHLAEEKRKAHQHMAELGIKPNEPVHTVFQEPEQPSN